MRAACLSISQQQHGVSYWVSGYWVKLLAEWVAIITREIRIGAAATGVDGDLRAVGLALGLCC